jgi:hypothetical protein
MLLGSVRAGGMRGRLKLVPALLSALLLACAAAAPAHATTLTRGFEDDVWFNAGWEPWMQKTVASGAKIVSLEVDWAEVEPNAPSGAYSRSPSSNQYGFLYVDNVLNRFKRTGVQPLLLITDAPRWAQAAGGTAEEYEEGGYEPNDAALQAFAQALAKRYSGHFRDPANPRQFLPAVHFFQAWAEGNMIYHLSPQWTKVNGHLVNDSPGIYRGLLNSVYAGIKAGNPAAKVIFTGLAPYGNPPGGPRTPPVSFLRSVLCLNPRLQKLPCSDPAHFDILAADPYDIGSPTTHALSPTDASAPDMGRLTRIVRAAIRARTVLPSRPKPLWITEFSYDSNPPNTTRGTPSEAEQARWLEESFYVFAHEGASTVIWYLLHDQTGNFTTDYFSGVYFHNGRPKTSVVAYRFPFVVMPHNAEAQAWGIAPSTGTVTVQRQVKGAWVTVFSFHAHDGATFARAVPRSAHGLYRAVEGSQISLVWTYRSGSSTGASGGAAGGRPGSAGGSG